MLAVWCFSCSVSPIRCWMCYTDCVFSYTLFAVIFVLNLHIPSDWQSAILAHPTVLVHEILSNKRIFRYPFRVVSPLFAFSKLLHYRSTRFFIDNIFVEFHSLRRYAATSSRKSGLQEGAAPRPQYAYAGTPFRLTQNAPTRSAETSQAPPRSA